MNQALTDYKKQFSKTTKEKTHPIGIKYLLKILGTNEQFLSQLPKNMPRP